MGTGRIDKDARKMPQIFNFN